MLTQINNLDQFEEEYKKGIGVEQDLSRQRFLIAATRDNIINFADAIGDNNPLWINPEYAARSRFGRLTAPPTFLYNIHNGSTPSNFGAISVPILNITLLYAGAGFEFFRPIYQDDEITLKGRAVEITRKQSKALGPMLFVAGEASYYNQKGQLLGILRTTTCRYTTPGGQAIEFDRKARSEVNAQSPDVLAFERSRRGSQKRCWEDIEVGMEITPLDKGVLTLTEISRYGTLVSPMPRRIETKREAVDLGFERETHQKRAGLENASDYGPQRICWMGQLVTDWMGDDGILKKLSGQIRHPNLIGDISVVKGRVTNKYIKDGEHLVDCEIRVENQAGLVISPGAATVVLPVKS
jgi:acyl dehydratase